MNVRPLVGHMLVEAWIVGNFFKLESVIRCVVKSIHLEKAENIDLQIRLKVRTQYEV